MGRIEEISYAPASLSVHYVDPVLFARRAWKDKYLYSNEGQLIGWNRNSGQSTRRFTRLGAVVVESEANGRPVVAELICYEIFDSGATLKEIR